MKTNPLLLLLPLALTIGCQAADDELPTRDEAERIADTLDAGLTYQRVGVLALTSRRFTKGTSLRFPTRIASIANRIVVLDARADSLVSIFDAANGDLVDSFGKRSGSMTADGFSDAWDVFPVATDSSAFWLQELRNQRLTLVSLRTGSDNKPGASLRRRLALPGDEPVVGMVQLRNRSFGGVGYFTGGRIAYFDSTGRFLHFRGPNPPGDTAISVQLRQHAYQSVLRSHPNRSMLAVATRHAGLLEILTWDGRLIAVAKTPVGFVPDYDPNAARMVLNATARIGYLDLATTDRHILALFSGRIMGNGRVKAFSAEYVHVFDWHGNLARVFRLETDAVAIAVDSRSGALYALPRAVEEGIRIYEVASALRSLASDR